MGGSNPSSQKDKRIWLESFDTSEEASPKYDFSSFYIYGQHPPHNLFIERSTEVASELIGGEKFPSIL